MSFSHLVKQRYSVRKYDSRPIEPEKLSAILEAGTYYLKETKTLDGYNLLDKPKEVIVGDTTSTFFVILDENKNVVDSNMVSEGQTKKEYTATSVTVENSKGVQLPSTGGKGTMMLITFGTLIAMGFAILLITQKKMTVYHD